MWTLYRHYKGGEYLCLGQGLHSESLEPETVYLTLYHNPRGSLWLRPAAMFHDQGGPGGQQRFAPIGSLRRLSLGEPESDVALGFGFDAWGDSLGLPDFVRSYDSNRNMLRGQRYLLEDSSGAPVATVNTIRFSPEATGIAWLATSPSHRRQGYASLILRAVMALGRFERPDMKFLLFSEISPEYYEKLGFRTLPEPCQKHLPSLAMGVGEFSERELAFVAEYF